MVKAIGDRISMSEYNGLVYLLRKFKKLIRHETISNVLETDIGILNVSDGFINVGENFIIENDVIINSQNCLPLTTYNFTFYIVNVDTSETVLEIPVTLSASTDEYGNLEITIPENLLSDSEEIRRDIKIEITFLEHEGVTPSRQINLDLTTDKKYISNGETATVTATLLDINDEPLHDYTVYFDVNGEEISRITNSDGEAVLTFTGTGDTGVLNIKVLDKEINIIDYYFYDHAISTDYNPNYWGGYWEIFHTQNSSIIRLCDKIASNFCPSVIPTQFDITKRLEFDTPYSMEFDILYTLDENVHLRVWDGNTSPFAVYFDYPINKTGHYKLIVKEDVIRLWINNNLIEKQISVTGDTSVSFVSIKTDTKECKLLEFANLIIYKCETYVPPVHNYSLSLTGASIIESGNSDTITATLLDNGVAVEGETLSYHVKHGSTVIDSGSGTTDSNGQVEIDYTGTGVGDVDVIVSFGMSLQETFVIEDCIIVDPMTTNISGNWNWDSNMTHNHNSNGVTFYRTSGVGNMCSKSAFTLPSNFEVEYTYMGGTAYSIETNVGGLGITHDINGHQTWYYYRECGNQDSGTVITVQETVNSGDVFKITRENHVLKVYRNDVLKHTITKSTDYNYIEFVGFNNSRNTTLKDIKVKAL